MSTGQGILGYNMFAYCNNNPVNMADPSGEIPIATLIFIGSIVAGILASGYVAYTSYECTGEVDVLNTVVAGVSTFMTCYSFGMTAYCMYLQFCQYNCYTPRYDVGGGAKGGSKALPNVGNATINPKKLTGYALNPNHPVGGNKAKVFNSALGYNQSNADDLMKQIYKKLPNSEAVLGTADVYGQRYTVDIPITGPNGNTVNVRTAWIIRPGSDIAELITLYVNN